MPPAPSNVPDRRHGAATICCYALLSAFLLHLDAVPARGLLSPYGGDAWSSVWFLHWWPWAIAHGQHPLRSAFVYAPGGYDLPWATPVPTAALLGLPITLLWGAPAAFDVLTLLAPVGNGAVAFLLARRLGAAPLPASLAGAIYGFSPYETAQLLGHLNLDLTFPIPLACLLAVERVHGRLRPRNFVLGLLALLLLQFGLSVEVFASACVFAAVGWVLFLLASAAPLRSSLLRLIPEAALAIALAVLVLSPWLHDMARGASRIPPFINPPWAYSADALNFVVPTRLTLAGGALFAPLSDRFSGNMSEQGSYLGLPLLLILALLFRERRRDRLVLALLALTALIALCSLGPSLHAGRWDSRIPMPWWFAFHLPLLRGALPARFSLYVSLGAALAAALWASGARTVPGRRVRIALLLLAALALLPDRRTLGWSSMPTLPFFRPDSIATALGPDRPTVLVLPYLVGTDGGATPAMLWQWQSGMRFRQAGGYLSFVPTPEAAQPLVQELLNNSPAPDFADQLAAYSVSHHLSAVIAGPGTGAPLLHALVTTGWQRHRFGAVTLFRVPPPATMHFVALGGDIWPSGEAGRSWMGREVSIETRGRAVVLHLDGRPLPLPATTITVLPDGATPITYRIAAHSELDIPLPADGRFRVRPGATFSPRIAFHTPDPRELSFLLTLGPPPASPPATPRGTH